MQEAITFDPEFVRPFFDMKDIAYAPVAGVAFYFFRRFLVWLMRPLSNDRVSQGWWTLTGLAAGGAALGYFGLLADAVAGAVGAGCLYVMSPGVELTVSLGDLGCPVLISAAVGVSAHFLWWHSELTELRDEACPPNLSILAQ